MTDGDGAGDDDAQPPEPLRSHLDARTFLTLDSFATLDKSIAAKLKSAAGVNFKYPRLGQLCTVFTGLRCKQLAQVRGWCLALDHLRSCSVASIDALLDAAQACAAQEEDLTVATYLAAYNSHDAHTVQSITVRSRLPPLLYVARPALATLAKNKKVPAIDAKVAEAMKIPDDLDWLEVVCPALAQHYSADATSHAITLTVLRKLDAYRVANPLHTAAATREYRTARQRNALAPAQPFSTPQPPSRPTNGSVNNGGNKSAASAPVKLAASAGHAPHSAHSSVARNLFATTNGNGNGHGAANGAGAGAASASTPPASAPAPVPDGKQYPFQRTASTFLEVVNAIGAAPGNNGWTAASGPPGPREQNAMSLPQFATTDTRSTFIGLARDACKGEYFGAVKHQNRLLRRGSVVMLNDGTCHVVLGFSHDVVGRKWWVYATDQPNAGPIASARTAPKKFVWHTILKIADAQLYDLADGQLSVAFDSRASEHRNGFPDQPPAQASHAQQPAARASQRRGAARARGRRGRTAGRGARAAAAVVEVSDEDEDDGAGDEEEENEEPDEEYTEKPPAKTKKPPKGKAAAKRKRGGNGAGNGGAGNGGAGNGAGAGPTSTKRAKPTPATGELAELRAQLLALKEEKEKARAAEAAAAAAAEKEREKERSVKLETELKALKDKLFAMEKGDGAGDDEHALVPFGAGAGRSGGGGRHTAQNALNNLAALFMPTQPEPETLLASTPFGRVLAMSVKNAVRKYSADKAIE